MPDFEVALIVDATADSPAEAAAQVRQHLECRPQQVAIVTNLDTGDRTRVDTTQIGDPWIEDLGSGASNAITSAFLRDIARLRLDGEGTGPHGRPWVLEDDYAGKTLIEWICRARAILHWKAGQPPLDDPATYGTGE